MRIGSICPHPSKSLLHKLKHKTCDTVTWAITLWLMITPRFTGMSITVMLPTTWVSLPRHRLPHPPPYVLTSLFRIQISNQAIRRSRLTYSTTQLCKLLLALLKPFSMNGLNRALSPTGWPTKYYGSSRSSTCKNPIHKSPSFVWNPAMPMESG